MTLIFDFDGTLANTLDLILDIYNDKITKEFSCKFFDKSQFPEFRKKRPSTFIREFGVHPMKLPFIIMRTRHIMIKSMNKVQPFEGIPDLLKELYHRKVKMGIVTSNTKKNVEIFLEEHKMRNYFSFVRSNNIFISKKIAFRKVIKKHQLKREEIIYIGDETRDIRSSRAANIRCVAVTWGHQDEVILEMEKPDKIIRRPSEILTLLNP